MAKNNISPEVRAARAANMRLQNYKRLMREGRIADANDYAAKNGVKIPEASAPTIAPYVAPTESLVGKDLPVLTHATVDKMLDQLAPKPINPMAAFQAQIDAAINDDLDAVSAPLPEQKVATPPPEPASVADLDLSEDTPPPPPTKPAPLPWPEKTDGEIVSQCVNPALVIVKIADGRRTSMFNYGQRPWRIGARVRIKISQRRGPDAIYETDWEAK